MGNFFGVPSQICADLSDKRIFRAYSTFSFNSGKGNSGISPLYPFLHQYKI